MTGPDERSSETFDETGLARTIAPSSRAERADASFGEALLRERVMTSLFGGEGEVIRLEHFTLLGRIGAGAMGELYLAHDERLGRKVALKLVRRRHDDGHADDRLLREAQTLARISHPNVVTVFEAGVVEGRVYVAMEFVRGQTLAAWLKSAAALPERQRIRAVLRRFVEAGRGLAAVHRAGLAHRDFKPDNVLVGEDERVRVVDFGLARSAGAETGQEAEPVIDVDDTGRGLLGTGEAPVGESGRTLPTLTATGAVQGTPRYMAPEQWEGRRGDARSDQFSFCVALYEALWASRPFQAEDVFALSRAVTHGELQSPPRKSEVPAALRAAVLRGLATEPGDRFRTLDDLLVVLERFVAPRRWWIPVALGLGVLALLAILVTGRSDIAAPDREWLDRWERERIATQHLLALEAQIAPLLAEGRDAEADDAFEAFVDRPEHTGTHALARGWLGQAERARARGAREDELAALANAHIESPGADQRAALLGLARIFARDRNHVQLAATLDTLDGLGLPQSPELSSELDPLRVQVALARCDFARAERLLSEQGDTPQRRTIGPAVAELGRFTATELETTGHGDDGTPMVGIHSVPGLDLDADDRNELILLPKRDTLPVIVAASPSLPVLQTLELPQGSVGELFVPRPSASSDPRALPSLLGMGKGEEHGLFELIADTSGVRARLLHSWSGRPGAFFALGDLDGRPDPEVYVAHTRERHLFGLRAEQGRWETWSPHPPTDAANSVMRGVAVGDLDGDGRDELVVAAAEWAAYDVRILRPSLARPDRLELVARAKLGTVAALALVPDPTGPGMRIIVAHPHAFPSRKMFPSRTPAGEPEGFYQLRWRGEGHALERVAHLPGDGGYSAVTGDFDANGHVDYAAGIIRPGLSKTPAMLVWLAQADGSFADLVVGGLWPIGAAELDGDDDDELIVVQDADQRVGQIRGPVGVLGSGDDRLPPIELTMVGAQPPPRGLDATLDRRWQRAEQLAAIGLTEQAGETLGELAMVADPQTAARARQRAAEIAEQSGRLHEAARLYERAASPDALARAVELHDRLHGFADAQRIAEMLAGHSELAPGDRARWRTRAAELGALAEPRSRRVFEFDEALDETWRITADLAIQREAGGLRVDTVSGGGRQVFARWPVIPTGEPIDIQLELDLLRLEWGAELGLQLHHVDAPDESRSYWMSQRNILLGVGAWGGGFIYRLNARGLEDRVPESRGLPIEHPSAEPPPERRRYRLGFSWVPDRETTWVSVEGPGVWARQLRGGPALPPGRYELRLVGSFEAWVHGTFWIDRLTVAGLVDDPDAPPLERDEGIRLALANGEPELAMQWLDEEPDDPLLRMLVLDELGRWDEAQRAFELAVDGCAATPEAEVAMTRMLILQPDRFGPTLRRLCPPRRFQALVWTTLQSAIFQHPELEDVFRTLTAQLIDLDTNVRDPTEGLLVLRLLEARAHGWRQQGARAAARADLVRGMGLAEALIDRAEHGHDPVLLAALRDLLAALHRMHALTLLEQGNEAEAMAELDRAIEASATPELVADMIAIQPEFAPLRERKGWFDSIERVRAGLDQRR